MNRFLGGFVLQLGPDPSEPRHCDVCGALVCAECHDGTWTWDCQMDGCCWSCFQKGHEPGEVYQTLFPMGHTDVWIRYTYIRVTPEGGLKIQHVTAG